MLFLLFLKGRPELFVKRRRLWVGIEVKKEPMRACLTQRT